jgi:hypothetical protein
VATRINAEKKESGAAAKPVDLSQAGAGASRAVAQFASNIIGMSPSALANLHQNLHALIPGPAQVVAAAQAAAAPGGGGGGAGAGAGAGELL